MDKKHIRKQIIELRNNLNTNIKSEYDRLITSKVLKSPLYIEANSIFVFIGFGSEVNTIKIIEDALSKGKKIYVPKIENKIMKVINITSLDNLKPGVFGILEPHSGDELEGDCDLILMPGVAFTKSGDRLGYGAGYYDKYLSKYNKSAIRMAIAYSVQIVDVLPTDSYDKKVHYILTEDSFLSCQAVGMSGDKPR